MGLLIIVYLMLTSAQHSAVSLVVLPATVERGRPLHVLCSIAPRAYYHAMAVGIRAQEFSIRFLRGAQGIQWHALRIVATRCGYGLAFCEVINVRGELVLRKERAVRVVNCPEGDGR